MKALAQTYTAEAITTLARIMQTGESEQSRIAAARELLDRACGRPAQAVTGADGAPLPMPIVVTLLLSQAPHSDVRD